MLASVQSAVVAMTPSSGSSAAASNLPCAACKFLRRKCQPDCVFAPYFPPDKSQKFVQVHKVFGASNVTKLLSELNPFQREDAVNSLAYEAETRLRDPVYGCVGVISILQHQLRELQQQLARAGMELSKYQAAAATLGAATAAAVAGNVNQQLLFGEQFFLSPVAGDVGGQGQQLPMGRGCDAVDAAVRMAAHGGSAYDAAPGGSFASALTMNVPSERRVRRWASRAPVRQAVDHFGGGEEGRRPFLDFTRFKLSSRTAENHRMSPPPSARVSSPPAATAAKAP